MANEVRIRVKVIHDDTDLTKVKDKVKATSEEIEKGFGESGKKSGDKFGSGLIDKFKGIPFESTPMLAQIGVAASPLIGATISGAIIGGAGIGGVVGGVVLAARDPRVQVATGALGANIMASLTKDAKPFIKPLIDGVGQLQGAFDRVEPHIQNIFKNSSTFLTPLLNGIGNGLQGLVGGLDTAIGKAGSTINAFGGLFDKVFRSVGTLLTTVSSDSDDSATAINDLGSALSTLITVLGYVILGLTEFYGKLHDVADGIVDAGREIGVFNEAQSTMGTWARHAGGSLKDEADAIDDTTSALKALTVEMKAQTDPLFAMITAQKEVTTAQKNYNKALQDHGPKSQQAKEALTALGQAAFGLQGAVANAAGGFNGHLTPAMKTALTNAGLTKSEIKKLEGQLRSAASAADAWAGNFTQTYTVKYKVVGSKEAAAFNKNSLPTGLGQAHGGVKGAASGMNTNGLTWVGENGPELVDLPTGASVHTAGDSQRLAAQKGGGGSQPLMVQLVLDGAVLVQKLVDPLRDSIRSGGGNVQTYLGQA